MTDMIRIGVIGTGMGAQHVALFGKLKSVEVAAVCSARLERAQAVAERFGVPRATDDYRELLEPDAGIDALVVATPPALHAPICLAAIAAGKHLFCEKPLASTLEEAVRMRDAAQAAGVVHMVNFQMRFARTHRRAHELIEEGYLGRLAMADIRISMNPADYLQAPLWSGSKAGWFTDQAQSGGLLFSSAGPHAADLIRWYGGPIAAVAAGVATTRPAIRLADGSEIAGVSAEDAYLVLVRFDSGALGTLRGVPIAHHRGGWSYELEGGDGTLLIEEGELRGATASDEGPQPLPLPEDGPGERVAIASRFIDAIRSGGSSPTLAPSFDDGVAAQALLAACAASVGSGKWVDVEEV